MDIQKICLGMLLTLSWPLICQAENEEGSGNPTVQLVVTGSQRVVVQIQETDALLMGGADLPNGYGELVLDQYDSASGALIPDQGHAEVLLGCYQADVLLYRQEEGVWIESVAVTVDTQLCVTE